MKSLFTRFSLELISIAKTLKAIFHKKLFLWNKFRHFSLTNYRDSKHRDQSVCSISFVANNFYALSLVIPCMNVKLLHFNLNILLILYLINHIFFYILIVISLWAFACICLIIISKWPLLSDGLFWFWWIEWRVSKLVSGQQA